MGALSQSSLVMRRIEVPNGDDCGRLCIKQLLSAFEPEFGGFSKAPKFPQPVNFNFLLRWHLRSEESADISALDMCVHTLRMMAKGGIFDHVTLVNFTIFFYPSLETNCPIFRDLPAIRPIWNGTCLTLRKCFTIKLNWHVFTWTHIF